MNRPYAFWDSSVLVALCLTEGSSEKAKEWALQFNIVACWATPVEVHGAIARTFRSVDLADKSRRDATAARGALEDGWLEITPSDEVRDLALVVLDRHPLRAADALQLAAALVWCRNRPKGRTFISGDARLCEAATHVGFTVLNP